MERRTLNNEEAAVHIEERDGHTAVITGHAAVFFRKSDAGTEFELFDGLVERIMPGAFDEALRGEDDVAALFNHDVSNLLGRRHAGTLKLSVDKRGLKYEIEAPDTQIGRDVVTSVRRGDLSGSSFAFAPTDTRIIQGAKGKPDVREINGVQLFDVGPVTYPAYPSTDTGVRGLVAADVKAVLHEWERAQAGWARNARAKLKRAWAVEVG